MDLTAHLTEADRSRLIEMAWEDRTPFEMIRLQYGLSEASVIVFMRSNMKKSSFKMWRKRMKGRLTKHRALKIVSSSMCDLNDVSATNTQGITS